MKNKSIDGALKRAEKELKELDSFAEPVFEYLQSTELLGDVLGEYERKITRVNCTFEDLKRRVREIKN